MGIVARQASKNAASILLGTISGAVNTVLVLPLAFEGDEAQWGLIKVMTGYALVFAQFFHGGVSNAIIRFFPKLHESERSAFLGFAFLIPAFGAIALAAILAFGGIDSLQLVNAKNANMLQGHLVELLLLATTLILFFSLYGYVSAILKTTVYQFLNEAFLKSWYLLVAVGFLFKLYDFNMLLLLYITGYVVALIVLLLYSFRHGFSLGWGKFSLSKREFTSYSIYSILDKGAGIVVNNLDILMVGILIGLEDVAFYTLAFYIGAVTMIPQKSILTIAYPLASKAITEKNHTTLGSIYKNTSYIQLAAGCFIFIGVWVSIDHVMELLPAKYGLGKWVVLWIGLSKLFNMATGISGGILVFSEHYKLNFRLNLLLIVLSALTNYFFIHRGYLDWGITGAAFATALTFATYNLLKVIYIQIHFKLTPFSTPYLGVILAALVMSLLYFWVPTENPWLSIFIKSGIVSIAALALAKWTGLLDQILNTLRGKASL